MWRWPHLKGPSEVVVPGGTAGAECLVSSAMKPQGPGARGWAGEPGTGPWAEPAAVRGEEAPTALERRRVGAGEHRRQTPYRDEKTSQRCL